MEVTLGNTERAAWAIAEDAVERAGFRIWDVIFEKEGAMKYLRVLFYGGTDSDGKTADIDVCEAITRELNPLFDKEKFIDNVDILEIGSRGLSARLRHNFHFREAAEVRAPVKYSVRDSSGGKLITYTGIIEDFFEESGAGIVTVTRDSVTDGAIQEKLNISALVKMKLNY